MKGNGRRHKGKTAVTQENVGDTTEMMNEGDHEAIMAVERTMAGKSPQSTSTSGSARLR